MRAIEDGLATVEQVGGTDHDNVHVPESSTRVCRVKAVFLLNFRSPFSSWSPTIRCCLKMFLPQVLPATNARPPAGNEFLKCSRKIRCVAGYRACYKQQSPAEVRARSDSNPRRLV